MKEINFGLVSVVTLTFLIVFLGGSVGTLAVSQNITITTSNDLIIRQNTTDNTFSFPMFFFFDDYNNITSTQFSITNSTHNISFNTWPRSTGNYCGHHYFVWSNDGVHKNKHYINCQFNITQYISRGIYNLTLNVTDTFNNTYLPYVEIKITPSVASLKTVQLNGTTVSHIDYSNDTNSSLIIKQRLNLTSLLSVALYTQDPGIPAYDPFNTSQFVEFIGSKTWEFWYGNIIEWVEIRIHYTDAQIAALGLQESTLKLKSYNESIGSWQACAGSSVNMTRNYVYCNSTHLSTWTVVGEPIQATSSTPASSSSGGGGGGGSGGGAAATTTPAAPAKETKTETVAAPVQTLPSEIRTTAVAPTNIPLLEGKQELIQAISPQDLGIQEIDVEKINIVQTGNAETIFTTSSDSISAIEKISGLEENTKQVLDEIKNQISAEQVLTLPIQASLQVFEVKSAESGKSAFVSKVSLTFVAEENLENVKILQVIPKSVAQNVAEVTFLDQRPIVLQADPVVEWSFESVTKGETKDISYLVKKKVDSLDATTVAVAKQQLTGAEQAPMYDYITVIVAVIIIVIIVVTVIAIRRRK